MIKFEFLEAACIVDAMGGERRVNRPNAAAQLWASVRASMDIDRIHEKWDVNADALGAKLFDLTAAQAESVMARIHDYYDLVQSEVVLIEGTMRKALVAVGLVEGVQCAA